MPAAEFSPPIQFWYNKIHAYEALIQRKEGKTVNNTNTLRFAKRKEIKNAGSLSMVQLKDGLHFSKNRKKQLNKQAKGLRKINLRDCLIRAQEDGDEAKQKCGNKMFLVEHFLLTS